MIKMIVSDMDGTLLDSQKQLPKDFTEVFHLMQDANIQFVVASGRQYYTLVDEFTHLEHNMAFAAENGGFINWKGQSKVLNPIKAVEAKGLIEKVRQLNNVNVILCGKHGAYIENTGSADFMNELDKYYVKHTVVEDLLSVDDEILKIAINDFSTLDAITYPEVKSEFNEVFQISKSSPIWLDVMPKGVNKGVAIEFLQEQFGVLPSETMVFGDYLNDYEMLQKGDYSYAMDNAHPDVKAIAKFIAPSNDCAGVTAIIREQLTECTIK